MMNDFRKKSTIHEIKNQLSVCDLYVEVIRRTLEKRGVSDEGLDRALKNIKTSLDLIAESAKSLREAEITELHLAEIVDSTFEICTAYGPATLKNGVAADCVIKADRLKFISALTNLVKNAIEAGATVVTVDGDKNGIKVTNNGAQIPQEVQARIFTEGFTTKPTGSGLGLMLTRENLRLQGFELRLKKSTPTETAFVIQAA